MNICLHVCVKKNTYMLITTMMHVFVFIYKPLFRCNFKISHIRVIYILSNYNVTHDLIINFIFIFNLIFLKINFYP